MNRRRKGKGRAKTHIVSPSPTPAPQSTSLTTAPQSTSPAPTPQSTSQTPAPQSTPPRPTPQSTSPTRMIPGSDDDDELRCHPPADKLPSTNYEQLEGQSSAPCQQLVTSPELSCYSIYVSTTIPVVICLSCSKAVHLDHVRSHLVSSHGFKGVPNEDELHSSLVKLGALPTSSISFPTDSVAPIVGLDIVNGFKCLEDGCSYISTSNRSCLSHFQLAHPEQHANQADKLIETIEVQALYGFKAGRVVLKVLRDYPRPPTTGGYERYMSRVALRKPTSPPTYRLPPDKKFQSHFLSFTGWGSVLDGKDMGVIQALVKSPLKQDRFYPIIAGCRSYYQYIASQLPGVGDLFLRWINTSKS
jgi:hypothetical protein